MAGTAELKRVIVSTNKAPGAIGPYNQAVLVDRTLYIYQDKLVLSHQQWK